MPRESFLLNRIKAFGYATRGAILLVRTEASIKVQVVLALIITGLGFYFEISAIEWILQIIAIAMVLGTEGLNTAIEKIADFIHPEFNVKIGLIKDISAGAVMLVSVAAVIIGLIIYIPKIF